LVESAVGLQRGHFGLDCGDNEKSWLWEDSGVVTGGGTSALNLSRFDAESTSPITGVWGRQSLLVCGARNLLSISYIAVQREPKSLRPNLGTQDSERKGVKKRGLERRAKERNKRGVFYPTCEPWRRRWL